MAPPKKLNLGSSSQAHKTKQKSEKTAVHKPKRLNPLATSPERKEDSIKTKDKSKENEKKASHRKKVSSEHGHTTLSPQNLSDYKSVKKKTIKKTITSTTTSAKSKPNGSLVKIGHAKVTTLKETVKYDSKQIKGKHETINKPIIESLRTKHLTVELYPKKPEKAVSEKSVDKVTKLKPEPLTSSLNPIKAPMVPYNIPPPESIPAANIPTVALPKILYSSKLGPITESKPEGKESSPEIVSSEDAKRLTTEIQMKLAVHVTKVIQQKKIFAMACSNFSTIKTALLKRGWIQKFACEEPSLKTGVIPSEPEAQFTQRMLRNVPLNFVWVYAVNDWNDIKPQTLVNRFPRAVASYTFTTKIGLNQYLQQAYWYNEKGIAEVKFPRTYSILTQEDLLGFIEDYVMTACTCLLKLVVMVIVQAEHNIFKDGDVPLDIIDFAVDRCREYVAFKEHRDIDKKEEGIKADEDSIKRFLGYFYKVVHEGAKFQTASYLQTQGIYLSAKSALQEIQKFWPELKLDGFKNLWLLKQSNLNCGRGVRILTTLDSILNTVGEVKGPRYVIQKYIERPLLIHETKFDIRQWILLTGVNPIQIWMYDECYLRFSSQVFSLSDTSESVHLCNNVIQRKYKNAKRHPSLPSENMWDGTRFRKYLDEIGESEKWDKVIYPGMKQNIIATIMAAQESMIERANSFELYGIDFMLTEDFRPWLIEVNSSPAMGPTTSVTCRLCSQCLNDIIKVVVDRRYNANADTGRFKLIYKQDTPSVTRSMPLDFELTGRRMILMTRTVALLSKKYSSKVPRHQPLIVELSRTLAGKHLSLADGHSNSLISILESTDWVSEYRYLNKQYKKPIVAKEGEGQKQESSAEKNKVLTETIVDLIKTNVLTNSNQKTNDQKTNVVPNKTENQNKASTSVNLTNEKVKDVKEDETLKNQLIITTEDIIKADRSVNTENVVNKLSVIDECDEICELNKTVIDVESESKLEELLNTIDNATNSETHNKTHTETDPNQPLKVDKSTNTVYMFENLPISRIINMANNNQLQYMGCKYVEGSQPLNYKIYYSKAKSRFIVDIEDSNKRFL